MAADLAHELRNALFAISANADALELAPLDEPERRETCVALRSETARLATLTDDLAALGDPGGTARETAELAPLLREAATACSEVARRVGVTVESAAAGDLRVEMERERLLLAFQKLVANACRSTARGGRVRLEAEGFEQDARAWVRCAVHRTGTPHALGPGPRGPRMARGEALAMAIAEPIVARHGGRLLASRSEDGGTHVVVELPCV